MSAISLVLSFRERLAVLTLAALILGGGIYPQPGVMSRERAAEEILAVRASHGARDQVEAENRKKSATKVAVRP